MCVAVVGSGTAFAACPSCTGCSGWLVASAGGELGQLEEFGIGFGELDGELADGASEGSNGHAVSGGGGG